jgi:hypothetical protein
MNKRPKLSAVTSLLNGDFWVLAAAKMLGASRE